jgi:hypothetical protein
VTAVGQGKALLPLGLCEVLQYVQKSILCIKCQYTLVAKDWFRLAGYTVFVLFHRVYVEFRLLGNVLLSVAWCRHLC